MFDNLVFRGGYGLSYLGQSANGQSYGYSRTTPLVPSTDGGLTPAVSLSDPYPTNLFSGGQLLEPIGNSQGLADQPWTEHFGAVSGSTAALLASVFGRIPVFASGRGWRMPATSETSRGGCRYR